MDNFIEVLEVLTIAGDASLLGIVVWLIWRSENRVLDKVEKMIAPTINVNNGSSTFLKQVADNSDELKISVKDIQRTIHQLKVLLAQMSDRDSPTN